MPVVIGTAGWSIPKKDAASFAHGGTALQRYASRFSGVEINSSFYKPHRPATWARWAESVPPEFRFAVKMPKAITHERKLTDCAKLLSEFLGQMKALGPKLAILLVQLPPKLAFNASAAANFFSTLSSRTAAQLVCEPRHLSWFGDDAESLFQDLRVARAAVDPALAPSASRPGGWRGMSYWRLHGSPKMYRSAYGPERLAAYAQLLEEEKWAGRSTWCMFDNTASSAATTDALSLSTRLTEVIRAAWPAQTLET